MHQVDPLEVVGGSPKAVMVQEWFGGGSDPAASARTFWVPRSVCKIECRNGRDYVVGVQAWFLRNNGLERLM